MGGIGMTSTLARWTRAVVDAASTPPEGDQVAWLSAGLIVLVAVGMVAAAVFLVRRG